MGAMLWLLQDRLLPYVHGSWMVRSTAMAVLVGAGCFVYAVACFALGAFSRADLSQFFRRRKAN